MIIGCSSGFGLATAQAFELNSSSQARISPIRQEKRFS